MSAARAGLVVALPEECRSLTDRRVRRGESFALGEACLVRVAGIGADNAREAARRLVAEGASALVSWGCAAALAPALRPGDLCLPAEILDVDGTREIAWPAWHERVRNALEPDFRPRTEALVTVGRVLATTAEKQMLAAQFGAIAADMESAAVAAVAREHALPFLAVRAIADPLDMALPEAVLRATDAQGVIHPWRLAARVLRNPGEVRALLQLASHFRAALRTLRSAAHRMGDHFLLDAACARSA